MISTILLTIVYLFVAFTAYMMILYVILSYFDKKFLYLLAEQSTALNEQRWSDAAKYGDKLGSCARILDRLDTLMFFA